VPSYCGVIHRWWIFFNHVIPTEQKTYGPTRRENDCLRRNGTNAGHVLVRVDKDEKKCVAGEEMPEARFEPDTPQLHILGVKKEKKPVKTAHTSHTRWIISGYRFLGQTVSEVLWPPCLRISVCLILWGFLKNTVYSNHRHTL
jgi:hypothetical protein